MNPRDGERAVTTINFTRGVPANESFPIEEVINAAAAVEITSLWEAIEDVLRKADESAKTHRSETRAVDAT